MVQKFTLTYSRVDDIDIKLAVYLPERNDISAQARAESENKDHVTIPSVVFFHGGGLTAGDRNFFPIHFKDQAISESLAFISADYRLLFPYSAHDILEDVKVLFTYLSTKLNSDIQIQNNGVRPFFQISETLFAVSGSSAGAYPARLAALYAHPKPKALFSLYGTGGDLLSPFYIRQPLVSGWESNLGNCRVFMAPTAKDKEKKLPGISGCSMSPNLSNSDIPYHLERVWTLYVKLLESGTYLDHLMRYPGLGQLLLNAGNGDSGSDCSGSPSGESTGGIRGGSTSSVDDQRVKRQKVQAAVPQSIRHLFPQLNITKDFPPTYLVHGTNDRAVECRESKEMAKKLCELGVKCEIVLAGGLAHGFDMVGQAHGVPTKVLWDRYVGEVVPFLKKFLVETPPSQPVPVTNPV